MERLLREDKERFDRDRAELHAGLKFLREQLAARTGAEEDPCIRLAQTTRALEAKDVTAPWRFWRWGDRRSLPGAQLPETMV